MKLSSTVGVVLCGALAVASIAAAQGPTRRAPETPPDDTVGIAIALQVGGESYQFTGQGSCLQEPKGYIYETPAHLRTVTQGEGRRSISLTLWSPANKSADMFSLHVSNGGRSYQTNTIKGKNAGPTKGTGTVAFAPAGGGGTFTVNATAANGAKISGTIRCDAFRIAVAEGGN